MSFQDKIRHDIKEFVIIATHFEMPSSIFVKFGESMKLTQYIQKIALIGLIFSISFYSFAVAVPEQTTEETPPESSTETINKREKLLNWAEENFAEFFAPATKTIKQTEGSLPIEYRDYKTTRTQIFIINNRDVYLFGGNYDGFIYVGSLDALVADFVDNNGEGTTSPPPTTENPDPEPPVDSGSVATLIFDLKVKTREQGAHQNVPANRDYTVNQTIQFTITANNTPALTDNTLKFNGFILTYDASKNNQEAYILNKGANDITTAVVTRNNENKPTSVIVHFLKTDTFASPPTALNITYTFE